MKTWGNKNSTPILVTHGRMDNAGSFDRLIPLLPKSFYYICIDLPSHGKSTFLPTFFPIHSLDFVYVYKLVLDYFKREKYILLGHSLGAIISTFFTQLYPDYVEKIICIDSISAYTPATMYKDYLVNVFESVVDLETKKIKQERRTFTEEEVIEKIRNGRWAQTISAEAARPLALRMMESAGDIPFI